MVTFLFACALTLLAMKMFKDKYDTWKMGNPYLFFFMMSVMWYGALIFGQSVSWGINCWNLPWLQKLVYYDAFGPEKRPLCATHVEFIFGWIVAGIVITGAVIWLTNQLARLKFLQRYLGGSVPVLLRAVLIVLFMAPLGANFKAAGWNLRGIDTALATTTGQGIANMADATGNITDQVKQSVNKSPVIPPDVQQSVAAAALEKPSNQSSRQSESKSDGTKGRYSNP